MTMRLGCVEIVGAIGGRLERRWCATGVSSDSRTVRPGDLFFAIVGDNFDAHEFVPEALKKGAAGAVISRDVDLPQDVLRERCIKVADTRRALGDLAAWYVRRWKGTVIAITGSNGKTTTKDMIYHLLSGRFPAKKAMASFNNDIGVPHTIFQLEPDDKFAVLEMGTNAHGEIRRLAQIASPHIGVITNIGPSHLEKLGSLEGVAKAKGELLENLAEGGIAVLNADDPMTPGLRKLCDKMITFGMSEKADIRAEDIALSPWGSEFTLRKGTRIRLNVPGRHNIMNALASLAVCRLAGLPVEQAAERMLDFDLGAMRLSRENIAGVTVINDAYNANMGSMKAALDVFSAMKNTGRRFMICADMLELGGQAGEIHRELGGHIAGAEIDVLLTVGNFARLAGEAYKAARPNGECWNFDSAGEAGCAAGEMLQPGDLLLLKGSRRMKLESAVDEIRSALNGCGQESAAGGCRRKEQL